ncbi:MAG: dihydrofolate reductase [Lachnospiraceae bacterium]|nr:dihydrofolate reductase [Lachnospiraceae bacterium]
MNIIVTVDENWAIGSREKLLVQIPLDQKNLQQLTAGGIMVMGRKTMQAMPQGQPLYGRDTIVLSQNPAFKVRGATVVDSFEALQEELQKFAGKDVYVCGGESVYKQLLPQCDTVYVTMVEKSYAADKYFENLDKNPDWIMAEESDEQTYFDLTYYFRKYVRK